MTDEIYEQYKNLDTKLP